MRVALLLSGGVDSSVALRQLQEDGHDLTAFYLKIWLEDELSHLGECPWEEDLRGPTLFVVGGEKHGIPDGLLQMADRVLRLPMLGFIPSYNLQAAMAMVAGERMRQLAQDPPE